MLQQHTRPALSFYSNVCMYLSRVFVIAIAIAIASALGEREREGGLLGSVTHPTATMAMTMRESKHASRLADAHRAHDLV